jgi:hypothetical protein
MLTSTACGPTVISTGALRGRRGEFLLQPGASRPWQQASSASLGMTAVVAGKFAEDGGCQQMLTNDDIRDGRAVPTKDNL